MKEKKKYIYQIIVFIVLIMMTYLFIFKEYNINTLLNTIKNTNPVYIILSVISLIASILSASLFLKKILKYLGYKTNIKNCIGYTCAEFYFSGITPGGSGGQPIEMLEMKKDKIPYHVTSIIVLVELLIYKTNLILLATVGLILYWEKLFTMNKTIYIFIMIGFIISILLVIGLWIIIFYPKLSNTISKFIIKIIKKTTLIKNKTKIIENITNFRTNYQVYIDKIKNNKLILLNLFLIILIRRIFLLLIYYFIYRAFNLTDYNILEVISIQIFVILITDYVPIPGGILIAEGLLIEMNKLLYKDNLVVSAMLLQRTMSFYLLVLITNIIYVIFHISKRKEAQKIKEEY